MLKKAKFQYISCSRGTVAPACLDVLPENPGFRTVLKYDEAALFQYVYLQYRERIQVSLKTIGVN